MKCILHIGTEKTGTTFLQNWLYRNEAVLSGQGLALTHAAGKPNNRKLVAYVQNELDDYLTSNAVTNQDERTAFFTGFEAEFATELERLRATHCCVVLTSEHFHSRLGSEAEIGRLKQVLDRFFDDYRVICYFREQSRVRRSAYSTNLKAGYALPISEFDADASPDWHYYNYLDFFRKWENVFGMDSLVPRLYGKDHFVGGDIRIDFLKAILPDIDPGLLAFEEEPGNESVSAHQATVLRLINKHRARFIGRFVDPTPKLLRSRMLKVGYLKRSGGIVDPRQARFFEMFEESNAAFFKRYFGADKNLFDPPGEDPGAPEAPLSVDEAGLDEIFSYVLKRGVIAIRADEVDFLKDLADRIADAGPVGADDAIRLLTIAQRARPSGRGLKSRLEALFNAGNRRPAD